MAIKEIAQKFLVLDKDFTYKDVETIFGNDYTDALIVLDILIDRGLCETISRKDKTSFRILN